MRHARRRLAVLLPCAFGLGIVATPTVAFDPNAYISFLDDIRDLTAAELLDAHEPYGPYLFDVPTLTTTPEYLDGLDSLLAFTDGEVALLDLHGFMVSERLSYESYGAAFSEIWHADLPVFVSTDAILHALHRSYVDILSTVEADYLYGRLVTALASMHGAWPALNTQYGDDRDMRASLDDVDVYLAVARSLLHGNTTGSQGGNQATIDEIVAYCYAEQPQSIPLFNDVPRLYDFSQMKPRGHYADTEQLQRYFRAMMWLGRTELRLTPPEGVIPPVPDVSREVIDAFLLRELAGGSGGAILDEIDDLIASLVGDADNVTFDGLDQIATAIGLTAADELLDAAMMAAFETEIASGGYTPQAINSQILISDPMDPGNIQLPYAFLVMGQRFIIDSYVTGNVVYDAIEFEGTNPFRGLPDPFDVLYAIGNDDVLPFLETELETYHYAANLAALRYLIDGYDDTFWRQSLYSSWLNAIRTLSMTGRDPDVPDFMKTGAWQQQKMNTQLASWTELRHDNLLYAKQSYTGGMTCSYPRTYVEPVPEFFHLLETFAVDAAVAFSGIPSSAWLAAEITPFFQNMETTMAQLALIAEKELSGEAFTPDELVFLAGVIAFGDNCGSIVETGWYRELFFNTGDSPVSTEDLLIADVHTQPTDEGGAPVGYVLHAATGRPNMGIFLAAPPGQPLTAFAGPVGSFHEYTTMNFLRLTDQEWEALYESNPPTRPDWTFVYLADANGDVRSGPRLVDPPTPTDTPDPSVTPSSIRPRLTLLQNRPNPFNPSTVIGFRIDVAGRAEVTLRVFDVRGSLVTTLLAEPLDSGAYFVRWDGRNTAGREVPSGNYVMELRMGELSETRKMVVVR